MKTILRRVLWFCLGVLWVPALFSAEQLWTCGMHPQVIKKEAGNCPVCGMKLTPVRANGGAVIGNSIQIDGATIQRMNLKTALVTRGPVRREIRTVGIVSYNEQGLRDITTKYEGWIEKLFVNATWVNVKAGDPLFEIYSPDLYNAQLNYLVAVRSEGVSAGPLTRAAVGRLQLFDLSPEFIAELKRANEPRRTVTIRAPVDGVVIEKTAVVGQMTKAGERIYRMADLSSVWVLAQIYEQDLPFVQPGQPASVRLSFGPEQVIEGKIELLLPQIDEQTRSATARIILPNPERRLRPGMFADVRFATQLADSAVLVPDVAVLRSGERNTVFVAKDGGSFEPREVKLGARTAAHDYEVLSGLKEGERVVISGQFMLDSESQLREAIQKMIKAEGAVSEPAAGSAPAALTTLALATADAAERLAADDFAGYLRQVPALQKAFDDFLRQDPKVATGSLAQLSDVLHQRFDLSAAREDFGKFSTAVTDLARANHLPQTAKLHVFECPMTPGIGKGRWLQRTSELRNPFFGRGDMLTCGEELK